MTAEAASGLPRLDALNTFFWTSGADGRLRMLRCDACGHWLHPPNILCPKCGSEKLSPTPLSGRATIAAYTVNYQPWSPGQKVPYTIAVVELEEQPGLRLTTNIVNSTEPVWIGQPVKVVFEPREDVWIPLFEPA